VFLLDEERCNVREGILNERPGAAAYPRSDRFTETNKSARFKTSKSKLTAR